MCKKQETDKKEKLCYICATKIVYDVDDPPEKCPYCGTTNWKSKGLAPTWKRTLIHVR